MDTITPQTKWVSPMGIRNSSDLLMDALQTASDGWKSLDSSIDWTDVLYQLSRLYQEDYMGPVPYLYRIGNTGELIPLNKQQAEELESHGLENLQKPARQPPSAARPTLKPDGTMRSTSNWADDLVDPTIITTFWGHEGESLTFSDYNIEDEEEQRKIIVFGESREVAQARRRIKQSADQTAIVYYGVNDNGSLSPINVRPAVLAFAQMSKKEFEDENMHVAVSWLSGSDFYSERQQAGIDDGDYRERETGNVEYKSTGSHKTYKADDSLVAPTDGRWRVIKFVLTPIYDANTYKISSRPVFRTTEISRPFYTLKNREIEEDHAVWKVCETRPACYRTPGWHSLTKAQQEQAKAQDEYDLFSYRTFGKLTEAFISSVCTARQFPSAPWRDSRRKRGEIRKSSLRKFDLSLKKDAQFVEWLEKCLLDIRIIFEEKGIDACIDFIRETSAEMRVLWQSGINYQPRMNELTADLLYTLQFQAENVEEISTTTYVDFKTYASDQEQEPLEIPDYMLCVLGYMGRAMPRPSDVKVQNGLWDTYERFKDTQEVPPDLKGKITEWSKKYFKEMPDPDSLPKPTPSNKAGLEISRSHGGLVQLFSWYHNLCTQRSVEELQSLKLFRTAEWRKTRIDSALGIGNIDQRMKQNNDFCWSLSVDLLEPYIEHAGVCPGKDCKESHRHLTMMPFGIAEPGGKVRVPCLTTGLLSIACQPIRKAMWKIIKKDPRCSFRAKGATKEQMLEGFFKSLDSSDFVHSGDMTVSTDNFPFDFMRHVIEGMGLSTLWKKLAYLCCGPFVMLSPQKENYTLRSKLMVVGDPGLSEFPDHKNTNKPNPSDHLKKVFQGCGGTPEEYESWQRKRSNWLKTEDIPKRHDIGTKENPWFFNEGKGPGTSSLEGWEKSTNFSAKHQAFVEKCREDAKNFLESWAEIRSHAGSKVDSKLTKETKRRIDLGPYGLAQQLMTYENSEDPEMGYTNGPRYSMTPLERLKKMIKKHKQAISPLPYMFESFWDGAQKGERYYLTQKGLHMSTACSVAMLYSFNIFCDTMARDTPGAKGKSELCGDDSVRAGNEIYIKVYKEVAESLGAIFSKWKDVTARNMRGIFTELHLQNREILRIPKLKTIVRAEAKGQAGNDDGAPAWKKFISAQHTLVTPTDESLTFAWEEMYHHFADPIDTIKHILPLGLHPQVGGAGWRFPYPTGINREIWEAIKTIPVPSYAHDLSNLFLRPLAPYQVEDKRQPNLRLDPFLTAKPIKQSFKESQFQQGSGRWLYLEKRKLRGYIEAASTLDNPPPPVEFIKENYTRKIVANPNKEKLQTSKAELKGKSLLLHSFTEHKKNCERILGELRNMYIPVGSEAFGPPYGLSKWTNDQYDIDKSDLTFLARSSMADFETRIVNEIVFGPREVLLPQADSRS